MPRYFVLILMLSGSFFSPGASAAKTLGEHYNVGPRLEWAKRFEREARTFLCGEDRIKAVLLSVAKEAVENLETLQFALRSEIPDLKSISGYHRAALVATRKTLPLMHACFGKRQDASFESPPPRRATHFIRSRILPF